MKKLPYKENAICSVLINLIHKYMDEAVLGGEDIEHILVETGWDHQMAKQLTVIKPDVVIDKLAEMIESGVPNLPKDRLISLKESIDKLENKKEFEFPEEFTKHSNWLLLPKDEKARVSQEAIQWHGTLEQLAKEWYPDCGIEEGYDAFTGYYAYFELREMGHSNIF